MGLLKTKRNNFMLGNCFQGWAVPALLAQGKGLASPADADAFDKTKAATTSVAAPRFNPAGMKAFRKAAGIAD